MTLPKPEPGLVIRYSYLWRTEYLKGREEGVKDRPCAIILTTQMRSGETGVTVLPITHSEPVNAAHALEIPQIVKSRLGLDSTRSWVMLDESNEFTWPGPDLRLLPGGDLSTVAYGMLPPNFFNMLRNRYAAAVRAYQSKNIPRTE